jgi:peptide/nickel transport system substrate-binding protein
VRRLTASIVVVVFGVLAAWGAQAQSAQKVLRVVISTDLRILDPIWTTADITRDYGYMVFDTLFALDGQAKPQPQMVEAWTVSDDKLTYGFTLRDGLRWHDGAPVRAADCVASLERWMKRDVFGQKLGADVDTIQALDERSFRITLKEPFPLLLDALAKISNNVPFMMPERLARTDPFKQIAESVGSGPFKFVKEEWVSGSKAVFVKNTDYVPRKEPADLAAGGKVVKVDRVEWLVLPDAATATAAFSAGEADIYQRAPFDLLPVLDRNRAVTVADVDPLGTFGVLRFNHLQPPFDNPKMRQALLYLVDQGEYMSAVAGDEKNWHVCGALFVCGTPLASDAGAAPLLGPKDPEKARQLIKEAGYKGERLVILDPTDQPTIHPQALVTAEILRRAGLNVDLQAMDWGTLTSRRTSKEPVDKGGWNIFHTTFSGWDMINPTVNSPLRSNGDAAYFGWPTDDKIERLRDAWLKTPDRERQKQIATELQLRAYETVPYIVVGQFASVMAYRKSVTGIIKAPVLILWNVEKAG